MITLEVITTTEFGCTTYNPKFVDKIPKTWTATYNEDMTEAYVTIIEEEIIP